MNKKLNLKNCFIIASQFYIIEKKLCEGLLMKTILIGAGAIGGTVAVLTKNAGYDVSILCRSEKSKN